MNDVDGEAKRDQCLCECFYCGWSGHESELEWGPEVPMCPDCKNSEGLGPNNEE